MIVPMYAGQKVTLTTFGMKDDAVVVNPDTYDDGTCATVTVTKDHTPYLRFPTIRTNVYVVEVERLAAR